MWNHMLESHQGSMHPHTKRSLQHMCFTHCDSQIRTITQRHDGYGAHRVYSGVQARRHFAGCEAGAQVTPEVPVSANAVVGAVPPESRLKVTVAASLLAVVCAVVIGIMGYLYFADW